MLLDTARLRGGATAHLPVFIGPLCRRWISAQVTAGHYRNNPAFSPLDERQTAKNTNCVSIEHADTHCDERACTGV